VVYYLDRDGKWPELGRRLLRALQLNEPDDLIAWAQNASKTDIASLAVEVFRAQAKRDLIAADILAAAANSLASDAANCARRLVREGAPVHFIFAGGVLLRQPRFAAMVARELQRRWRQAIATPLKQESVCGALALAELHFPTPDAARAHGVCAPPMAARRGTAPPPAPPAARKHRGRGRHRA